MKTIREQVEQQLKEVTNIPPDKSQIKNELIEAMRWNKANKTGFSYLTYEDGVEVTLKWVLGIITENPIDEEYEES